MKKIPGRKQQIIDARARNISHNVRCLECGSQSIEESQADIAVLLRKVLGGRRRLSATADGLGGMLLGRFLVGTAMGVSPPVAALYITEVSPALLRGTYGSFTQIATCLGLICSFFIGIPAKDVSRWFHQLCCEAHMGASLRLQLVLDLYVLSSLGYQQRMFLVGREHDMWRVCFWVSTVPAALLALLMEFCAESPHWLFKRGRSADAEAEFAKLLGGLHVKSSMAELSKTDREDEVDRAMSMGMQAVAGSSLVSGSPVVYLSVGGVLLFVLSFAMGVGPVPGLLLSEIFPGRIRAKAMAICMAVHWVINFFVGLLFLRMLEQVGPLILYTVSASFCLVGFVFVRKKVQEIEMALLPASATSSI
ncbi:putative plastidic glucose transporter 3 [Artemisia annua]|uniref:Cytochrome c-type biogenesis protein n=1 Tax=Artemisia annua TaxID=35608 RepID=A0A2U1QJZ6_ARTAN|nr:putative plastidic glucose transporter 3 [Artemisia annua]